MEFMEFMEYPKWVEGRLVMSEVEEIALREELDLPPRVAPSEVKNPASYGDSQEYVPLEYPKWVEGRLVEGPDEELAHLEALTTGEPAE